MVGIRDKKSPWLTMGSNFFDSPPYTIIALYATTQFVISVPLESLGGTTFYETYQGHVLKMNEKNEDGLPKHLPFEFSKEMEDMVFNKCLGIFEKYAMMRCKEEISLQDYIRPSTFHISVLKDGGSRDGVGAKIMGEDMKERYPWETFRIAQNTENIRNSYGFGLAPVKIENLGTSSTVERFNASELFLAGKITSASLMGQVHTKTGRKLFFKPRLDMMAPEFNREVSVMGKMVECGLHRSLRVSPFVGLVVLENGLVAGMLVKWLEGKPLAEQDMGQLRKYGRVWREEVEWIVRELHRHGVVWGDVNVHNIFIDADDAAWVIDFGGNCNVNFIDESFKETEEGDWQGVGRVFEQWLPARLQAMDHPDRLP